MHPLFDLPLYAAPIGIGATALMDLWGLFESRVFALPARDYAMVGRWLGHFPRGRFAHENIAAAAPISGESVIGWAAHYATGILFAALLLAIFGLDWAHDPSLAPALGVGLVTVAAPFLILQPALGAGVAASRTPRPMTARLRSIDAHLSFGVGLYLAAEILSLLALLWGR
jgi:hypothetical protein